MNTQPNDPEPVRKAYSFTEFAQFFVKHRAWVYRQVAMGRIRAITGIYLLP
jgi:hypothetical protein